MFSYIHGVCLHTWRTLQESIIHPLVPTAGSCVNKPLPQVAQPSPPDSEHEYESIL